MWNSFVAILLKEFTHVFRDRGTLVISMVIPLFQLVLFGFIDVTVRDLPTVVVDQDRSRESRLLMDELRATRTFEVTHVTPNPRDAREDIIAGRAQVGIIIPPDFHDKRARHLEAKILVLINGSDSNTSSQALGAVNGIASKITVEEIREMAGTVMGGTFAGFEVQPIMLFNPDGRTANFIIPGLIAIIMQIVATILTAIAIVKEREQGTLEQLLVTPINPLGLMLGKVVPYLVIGVTEMIIVLTVMRFGFCVPIRGSLVFLFVMAGIYLFALLSLGLFLSTISTSQAQAQQLAMMFLLPSIFLSDYVFPSSGLPLVLRTIGRFLPATHMIAIMRGVVLRDAGPREMAPHVAALLAIAFVLVAMSARRFRKVAM